MKTLSGEPLSFMHDMHTNQRCFCMHTNQSQLWTMLRTYVTHADVCTFWEMRQMNQNVVLFAVDERQWLVNVRNLSVAFGKWLINLIHLRRQNKRLQPAHACVGYFHGLPPLMTLQWKPSTSLLASSLLSGQMTTRRQNKCLQPAHFMRKNLPLEPVVDLEIMLHLGHGTSAHASI